MSRNLFLCKASLLLFISSVATAAAQAPVEINFGVISTEASVNQKKNWEPFLQVISKSTGFKINGFYATDYAGVIEAMRFNKVQVAWFGNKSGMEAADRAGGEVFAQVVGRDGNVGYYSHVIVHRDSPFAKLDDILKCDKSLDFGIGDPIQLRASWCRRPTFSPLATSTRNPASRPCATPIMRRMAWRSPTARSARRPTTAKICSASP